MDQGPREPSARLHSGRHNLPREVVVASQRRRLLDAMAAVCAERGYAATTVSSVYERAGVSSATYYEHFASKEDCFLAAGQEMLAETMTVVAEAFAGKPAFEAFRDGIEALLILMADRPAYAKISLIDSRISTPRALELYRSGERALISMMEVKLASERRGSLPSSAPRAAIGGAQALVRRQISRQETRKLPRLLGDILYGALVPYVGREIALEQVATVKGKSRAEDNR